MLVETEMHVAFADYPHRQEVPAGQIPLLAQDFDAWSIFGYPAEYRVEEVK